MRTLLALMALLLAAGPARAQAFSVGLSAGVPLNSFISADGDRSAGTGRFTVGPAIRIRLPRRFAIDAELLYQRLEFGFASDPSLATVHRLEFPLMLQYGLPRLPARPFLHAGMSFNHVVAVSGASVCSQGPFGEEVYCIGDSRAAELRHRHTHGPLLGIGFEYRWRRVALSPELRVTRWIDRNFGTRDSPLRSSLTAVDLLCGIRF